MGSPLQRGRDVEDRDTADSLWVGVVNASFAERYWPGREPIGKTFSDVRTMDEVLARDTATRRAQLQVLGAFALVAVLLSGVGIYGLLAIAR